MHMATTTRRWTRADLASLPDDGNRYEVLDGELLVTPQASYDHQRVAARLMLALGLYCERHGLGEVVGPGAVVFDANELQPDVQVVPGARVTRGAHWKSLPVPSLAIEILSDSTSQRDLGKKRDAYRRIDIPAYWVVDPDQRHVLVWTRASEQPVTVTDLLRWKPSADVPPLEISLDSILPPAH